MSNIPQTVAPNNLLASLQGIPSDGTASPIPTSSLTYMVLTQYILGHFGAANFRQKNNTLRDLGDNVQAVVLIDRLPKMIDAAIKGATYSRSAQRAGLSREFTDAAGGENNLLAQITQLLGAVAPAAEPPDDDDWEWVEDDTEETVETEV